MLSLIVTLALGVQPDALPDVLPDAVKPKATRVLRVPVHVEVSDPAEPATEPEPVEWVRQCGPNGCRFIPIYRPWQPKAAAQAKSDPAAQPKQQRQDASKAAIQDAPDSGSAGRAGTFRRWFGRRR
jgi:hypothetical protein